MTISSAARSLPRLRCGKNELQIPNQLAIPDGELRLSTILKLTFIAIYWAIGQSLHQHSESWRLRGPTAPSFTRLCLCDSTRQSKCSSQRSLLGGMINQGMSACSHMSYQFWWVLPGSDWAFSGFWVHHLRGRHCRTTALDEIWVCPKWRTQHFMIFHGHSVGNRILSHAGCNGFFPPHPTNLFCRSTTKPVSAVGRSEQKHLQTDPQMDNHNLW